jgi:hypothetical protein
MRPTRFLATRIAVVIASGAQDQLRGDAVPVHEVRVAHK